MNLLKFLFGTKNDRELKRLWPIVRKVNQIEAEYEAKGFVEVSRKTIGEWTTGLLTRAV